MATSSWNAGIIRPVAVAPAGPFQDGAAPGVWTLDQQALWQKQGLWPIAGNAAPIGLFGSVGGKHQDHHFGGAFGILKSDANVLASGFTIHELTICLYHFNRRTNRSLGGGHTSINEVGKEGHNLRPPQGEPLLGRRDRFTFGGNQ